MPLVITHGWPGSIVEFLEVIDKLAHPERHGGDALDAFDVIAPSLPGYGFSGPPIRDDGRTGPIGPRAIAGLWHGLVHDKLNYRRPYGAQGGDWGAVVSSWLAFDHPVTDEKDDWKSGVLGLHLNMVGVRPGIDLKTTAFSPAEKAWLGQMGELDDKTAYQRIQATRPQTLGVALSDLPVGLAAWIVEKFRDWSDCNGDPLNQLLDGHAARQHHGLLADRHGGHRDLALSRRHRAEAARPAARRPGADADGVRRLPGRHRAGRRPRNGSSASTTSAAIR